MPAARQPAPAAPVKEVALTADGVLEVRGHFDADDCAGWIELLRQPVAEAGPLVVHVIDAVGMDLSRGANGFASQGPILDAYGQLLTEMERTQRPLLVLSDGFVRGGSMVSCLLFAHRVFLRCVFICDSV